MKRKYHPSLYRKIPTITIDGKYYSVEYEYLTDERELYIIDDVSTPIFLFKFYNVYNDRSWQLLKIEPLLTIPIGVETILEPVIDLVCDIFDVDIIRNMADTTYPEQLVWLNKCFSSKNRAVFYDEHIFKLIGSETKTNYFDMIRADTIDKERFTWIASPRSYGAWYMRNPEHDDDYVIDFNIEPIYWQITKVPRSSYLAGVYRIKHGRMEERHMEHKMKIEEILSKNIEELELANHQDIFNLLSGSASVGDLTVGNDKYDVRFLSRGNYMLIGLLTQQLDVAAFVYFYNHNNAVLQVKQSQTFPEYKNKGLVVQILKFVKEKFNANVMSDIVQTKNSEKMWIERLPKNNIQPMVYDYETGEVSHPKEVDPSLLYVTTGNQPYRYVLFFTADDQYPTEPVKHYLPSPHVDD